MLLLNIHCSYSETACRTFTLSQSTLPQIFLSNSQKDPGGWVLRFLVYLPPHVTVRGTRWSHLCHTRGGASAGWSLCPQFEAVFVAFHQLPPWAWQRAGWPTVFLCAAGPSLDDTGIVVINDGRYSSGRSGSQQVILATAPAGGRNEHRHVIA